MEEKIFGYTGHNTDSYFTLLDLFETNSGGSNSNSVSITKSLVLFLIGLYTVYVLHCIIRRICLNFQIPPDYTIYNRENCPICLNEFIAPVRLNCGHAFCIDCLLGYFTYNLTEHNCPLCRNVIRDFERLNKFTFENKERAHEIQLKEVLTNRVTQPEAFLQDTLRVMLLIVINIFLIGIMYCVVQWL